MSNQIVISSGAKVRELEGVLTGTSGIVSSVPLGAANGVATLDSGGKVPVSQLPSSVVTYLGTWNAATNTPTLANGTGDAGDMYICNVAGTVNFGAGPITFAVGDWVLYGSGTWQKSSGQNGTVTSVAASITGNAIGITGSPITTAGTLALAFAGTSGQYINGAGNLVTFPTIITEAQKLVTEVYNETGATLTKGTVVYINGGHGNLPTVTKAQADSEVNSYQTYGLVQSDITNMNNGYVVVAGALTDLNTNGYVDGTTLYLSPTTAGAYTSTKPTSPNHIIYVGVVVRAHPTQGVIEVKIQNTQELAESSDVLITSPANNEGLFYDSATSLWKNKTIAAALGYTPANDASVVHLTGNETIGGIKTFSLSSKNETGIQLKNDIGIVPVVSGYTNLNGLTGGLAITNSSGVSNNLLVPATVGYSYTFPAITGTIALLEGNVTYSGTKTFSDATKNNGGILLQNGSSSTLAGYMNIGGLTNGVKFTSGGGISNTFTLPSATGYTFTFPNATGTVALTSDLTGGTVTSVALSAPTGFSVTGSPVTTSGTLALAFAAGYSLPTTAKQSNWDDAYTNRITSATSPLSITSNVISISQANNTTNGYLSSTDWITFNSKQSALTNPVTGTGTTNYLPKFTGTSTIGNSIVSDNGSRILINTGTTNQNTTINASSIAMSRTSDGAEVVYFSKNTDLGSNGTANINGYDGIQFRTQGAETVKATLTASGNLGLGVTPSAWSGFTALQVGNTATWSTSTNNSHWSSNTYYNGSDRIYIGSDYATEYAQQSGVHKWFTAASGTANGTISASQVMTLTNGGNLLIGTTSDASYKLDVNGTGRFSGALTSTSTITSVGTSPVFRNTDNSAGNVFDVLWSVGGSYWAYGVAGFYDATNSQKYDEYKGGASGYRKLYTNGTLALTIASTGAATFSSSVSLNAVFNSTTNTPYIRFDESSNAKFFIGQRGAVSGDGGTGYDLYTVAGNDLRFFAGATKSLTLATTGAATFSSSVTATSFFESSDSRLKTLIQDNYQTKGIALITPKLYTKNGKVELGYYAQDFIGILDSAVSKSSDDMLSLSYREVHTAKIYALEQRIKELESKLN